MTVLSAQATERDLFASARRSPAAILFAFLFIGRTLSDTSAIGGGVSSALNLAITFGAIATGFALSMTKAGRGERPFVPILLVFIFVSSCYACFTFGIEYQIVSEFLRSASILGMAVVARAGVRQIGFERFGALVVAWGFPAVVLLVVALVTHLPLLYASGTSRAFGTFQQTNSAGAFVAFYFCVALYLMLRTRNVRYLFALLVTLAAAVSTLSLGGLSALLAGALIMLFGSGAPARLKTTAAVVIAGGGAAVLASGILSDRLSQLETTVSIDDANAGQTTNSLDWRFYNWKRLMQFWSERPLQGWGLGSTNGEIQPIGKQPHSEYVRAMVETGVVGVAILTILLLVLIALIFSPTTNLSRWGKTLTASSLAVFLVNAFASNTISYTPAMYLFVAMLAIGFGDRAEERDLHSPPVREFTSRGGSR